MTLPTACKQVRFGRILKSTAGIWRERKVRDERRQGDSGQSRAGHGGKLTKIYDLSGLVARLKILEPEFRAVEERAKASRKALAKRG